MGSDSSQSGDLTDLMSFKQKLAERGELPEIQRSAGGPDLQETPIEKIDEFESLEEYKKTHVPTPVQESLETPIEAAEAPPAFDFSPASELSAESPPEDAPPMQETVEFPPETAVSLEPAFTEEPAAPPPEAEFTPEPSAHFETEFPVSEPAAPTPPSSPEIDSDFSADLAPAPLPPRVEVQTVVPPSPAPKTAEQVFSQIRSFSENQATSRATLPAGSASIPFDVRIQGFLAPEERERLIDLLEREGFGMSESEIKSQLELGKVLLPRLSEYAAILVVQSLRSTSADLRIGPSELGTSDFGDDSKVSASTPHLSPPGEFRIQAYADDHPAERLPLSTQDHPPLTPESRTDVLVVSTVLHTDSVEIERTDAYQAALAALTRELRYRAHFKKAQALYGLRITVTPLLHRPAHYRLSLSATAIYATA